MSSLDGNALLNLSAVGSLLFMDYLKQDLSGQHYFLIKTFLFKARVFKELIWESRV
jgi:hypothetical protein